MHLGLKKEERFQFTNQKSTVDKYYFTSTHLMKEHRGSDGYYNRPSNVKLNYILGHKCQIQRVEKFNWC